MPPHGPPPPADAPQPSVYDTAAAAEKQLAAVSALLEQCRAMSDIAQLRAASDAAQSFTEHLLTALIADLVITKTMLVLQQLIAGINTEGRRATQAATNSTIATRATWAILLLVMSIGGGYATNVTMDALERRAQLAEKDEARASAMERVKEESSPVGPSAPQGPPDSDSP